MQPHQQRVMVEREELSEKINALGRFLQGAIYQSLEADERADLYLQWELMCQYRNALDRRIARF